MSAPVDVLAVMDAVSGILRINATFDPQRQHEEARAAVAEMIEAVEAALPPIGQLDRRSNRGRYELDEDQMAALYAALARVGGAK